MSVLKELEAALGSVLTLCEQILGSLTGKTNGSLGNDKAK